MEGLVRGNAELGARDFRLGRPGAGGDQNTLGGDAPPGDRDGVRSDERRAAANNLGAGVGQEPLIDPVEARDLAILVGDQLRPVESGPAELPTEASRLLRE